MSYGAELHWATLYEALADAVGDGTAIIQGAVRRSWFDLDDRAGRLASLFESAGIGDGDVVAQYLYNSPAYAESWHAAHKIGATPVNVNYRYLAEELAYIAENSGAKALVFHTSLSERVAAAVERGMRVPLLVGVDDGGDLSVVPGAVSYEDVLAAHEPAARRERSPKQRTMLYTGGTTGMPKGVMGRIGHGVRSTLRGAGAGHDSPIETIADAAAAAARLRAEERHLVGLVACPLMHGTGLVVGLHSTMVLGGTLCLLEQRRFDAAELWDLVAAEDVALIGVVGDPFARPMLAQLDRAPRTDLGCVKSIASSGAMFSTEVKAGLLKHLPQAVVNDYISSSEGLMGMSVSRAGKVAPTGRFYPAPGVKVFDDDDAEVTPGSGVAGIVGLSVGVPDGYYKDDAKSAKTFRKVDGVRYSFPGDWATVEADGALNLLGRGSQCINTGGEKVFPEEVEEVLKRHPAVEDCLVFGIPDERFGQRIAGVISFVDGASAPLDDVVDLARRALSSYKLPRDLVLLDTVPRTPAGKADYAAARAMFLTAAQ